MKRAIIFANGRIDTPPPFIKVIDPTDFIIAANGGSHHCDSLGITPNVIIGDFDSLSLKDISTYRQAAVEMIQHPTHKDETDLELAIKLAKKHDMKQIFIIGALGDRWDMTIANILLAAHPDLSHIAIRFLDGSQELSILRGEGQIDFDGKPGFLVSLIPIAGDARGITTYGLEYPLNNETLYFGTSRGVSNVISKSHAQIYIREGVILICLSNQEAN